MATNWNDLKHKSSPEVRATLKREAHDELERIGFGKLRQSRQQTQVAIAERLKIPQGAVSRMATGAFPYTNFRYRWEEILVPGSSSTLTRRSGLL
jgi:hypothetical protein